MAGCNTSVTLLAVRCRSSCASRRVRKQHASCQLSSQLLVPVLKLVDVRPLVKSGVQHSHAHLQRGSGAGGGTASVSRQGQAAIAASSKRPPAFWRASRMQMNLPVDV